MKEPSKLQELNRQRGELMFRFKGAIACVTGLQWFGNGWIPDVSKEIHAAISRLEAAYAAALEDIDRKIKEQKAYEYLVGKLCQCGSRKLTTVERNLPPNQIMKACKECGYVWVAVNAKD